MLIAEETTLKSKGVVWRATILTNPDVVLIARLQALCMERHHSSSVQSLRATTFTSIYGEPAPTWPAAILSSVIPTTCDNKWLFEFRAFCHMLSRPWIDVTVTTWDWEGGSHVCLAQIIDYSSHQAYCRASPALRTSRNVSSHCRWGWKQWMQSLGISDPLLQLQTNTTKSRMSVYFVIYYTYIPFESLIRQHHDT